MDCFTHSVKDDNPERMWCVPDLDDFFYLCLFSTICPKKTEKKKKGWGVTESIWEPGGPANSSILVWKAIAVCALLPPPSHYAISSSQLWTIPPQIVWTNKIRTSLNMWVVYLWWLVPFITEEINDLVLTVLAYFWNVTAVFFIYFYLFSGLV